MGGDLVSDATPACETRHQRPVPAVTWSYVFGAWLCNNCLHSRTAAEAQRCPGAYLDPRPVTG